MDEQHRSPLRILAPVALIAFAIAFCVVVLTSGGADGGGGDDRRSERADRGRSGPKRKAERPQGAQRERELPSKSYTVQTGDTLGAIALKTGLSVEKLQELNPELDPQALVSGQKVKLRE